MSIDRAALAERRDRVVNGSMCDEQLNGRQLGRLLEVRVPTSDWRIDYNLKRPYSADGRLSPVEFVDAWPRRQAHQRPSRVLSDRVPATKSSESNDLGVGRPQKGQRDGFR